jgi:hypothetical protein
MTDFDHELRATIPRILVEVVPGEALSVTVPILDGADDPVPVADADDWSALAQLRTQWSSTEVLHTFTTEVPANVSITEGAAGAAVLTATAAETAEWQADWTSSPQVANADLFVTDDNGVPRCLADLVFSLLPRNTRED